MTQTPSWLVPPVPGDAVQDTSTTVEATGAADVGDVLVVAYSHAVSLGDAGTTFEVSDSAGNVYDVHGPSFIGNNHEIILASTTVTAAVTRDTTFTVSIGAARAKRSMGVLRVTGSSGALDLAPVVAGANSDPIVMTEPSGTTQSGDLVVTDVATTLASGPLTWPSGWSHDQVTTSQGSVDKSLSVATAPAGQAGTVVSVAVAAATEGRPWAGVMILLREAAATEPASPTRYLVMGDGSLAALATYLVWSGVSNGYGSGVYGAGPYGG